MARRLGLALLLLVTAVPPLWDGTVRGQEVTLEYKIKAAFLYNFVRFVEWPASALQGPLTICVAGRNPLGTVLEDTVRGETVGGRPIVTRVILEPEPGCHVVFMPRGSAAPIYLRSARTTPVLTVGETDDFLDQGGIIGFVMDGGRVRFEISPQAAERVNLRVSARLLQLAQIRNPGAAAR